MLSALWEAIRPFQWSKNLALFAAVILSGQLFDEALFVKSLFGFVAFCLLSSSSYLVNDIVDVDNDRNHPVKKNRPIARGDLPISVASFVSLVLLVIGISVSALIGFNFFLLAIGFIIFQYGYSLVLKKKPVADIFGIAMFFIVRAFAGEVATGYHLPIWIMLTVIFLALFIASGKRRSELVVVGKGSRPALKRYGKSLLNFYTTMFAVCTLLTYSMYTFFEEPVSFNGFLHSFLLENMPQALDRKWFMLTIFPVIYGIMRYGQIIFEMQEGERPERIIATDIPLMVAVGAWGLMILSILYAL